MSASKQPLRGVHQRLAFPPPARRPSMIVWSGMKGLEDSLAWALFLVNRRVRDLIDYPPDGIDRWSSTADVQAALPSLPRLADALLLLGGDLRLDDETDPRPVARACYRLGRWASRRGYAELATQFAESAVALRPNNPRYAFEAGRINRLFNRDHDAELLYLRAIGLARARKSWEIYVRAHLGLGIVCRTRGQRERAAAHFGTAASAAFYKSGEKWLAGMTQHDLLVLHSEDGDLDTAFEHARKAYEWMPKHNERVPALVHDYCLLLIQLNANSLALTLLEMVIQKDIPPPEQVITWSTLGRAAAAAGNAERFHDAERYVQALLPHFDHFAAAAAVNLAAGAHSLGLTADAECYALRSADIARSRGDGLILKLAESLLHTIRAGKPAPASKDSPPKAVADLARNYATLLRAWRGPTRTRKHQAGLSQLGRV